MIQKGVISSVLNRGEMVTVTPYAGGTVTAPLAVQYFLVGALPINTPVVYALFDDNTGIVLARMDGDWNHVDPGSVSVMAMVSDDVCEVYCNSGSSDITATVVDEVCYTSCGDAAAVSTEIEDGICKVNCTS